MLFVFCIILNFTLNVTVIGQVDTDREHCQLARSIILFIVLLINYLVLY